MLSAQTERRYSTSSFIRKHYFVHVNHLKILEQKWDKYEEQKGSLGAMVIVVCFVCFWLYWFFVLCFFAVYCVCTKRGRNSEGAVVFLPTFNWWSSNINPNHPYRFNHTKNERWRGIREVGLKRGVFLKGGTSVRRKKYTGRNTRKLSQSVWGC